MPKIINEEIKDLTTRHQVGILRLSGGVLKKILPIMRKADDELVAKLAARGATLEGTVTSIRLKQLLKTVREITVKASKAMQLELLKELKEVAVYEGSFQKELLKSAIPIKLDIVSPSANTLKALVASNIMQGKLLSEWFDELSISKQRRVRDAIRQGMVQGETISQIIQRIRGTRKLRYKDGILEMSRRHTASVVRTSVANVASAARNELYKANSDIISKEQWVSTLDSDTCAQCAGLDGKKFELGKGIMPPAHVNCRCLRVPITKSWRELGFDIDELPEGTRASMNGQVPAKQTYGQWLKNQPRSVQEDALGVSKAKLFRNGGLDIKSFTNRFGDELTLKELRIKEAGAFTKAKIE